MEPAVAVVVPPTARENANEEFALPPFPPFAPVPTPPFPPVADWRAGPHLDAHPFLGRHVTEDRKNHDACEHGEATVDKGRHEGVVVDVRVIGEITGIGNHDGKADAQGEEDLAKGGGPDLDIAQLGKVWFEEPVQAIYGTGHGHRTGHNQDHHQEKRGHEKFVGRLDALLDTADQNPPAGQPHKGHGPQDMPLNPAQFKGTTGEVEVLFKKETAGVSAPPEVEREKQIGEGPPDNHHVVAGDDKTDEHLPPADKRPLLFEGAEGDRGCPGIFLPHPELQD